MVALHAGEVVVSAERIRASILKLQKAYAEMAAMDHQRELLIIEVCSGR